MSLRISYTFILKYSYPSTRHVFCNLSISFADSVLLFRLLGLIAVAGHGRRPGTTAEKASLLRR